MESRKFYHLWDLMKWSQKIHSDSECSMYYCLILWIFHEWIFFSFFLVHLKNVCCLIRNWTYHNTDHWYHKDINWKKNGFFLNLFLAMLRKMGISYCCFSHSEEISLILKINIDVKVAQNRKKLTHSRRYPYVSFYYSRISNTPTHLFFLD